MGTSAPIAKVKSDAKLHLGCGTITPSGWINVDGSWNARLAKHPLLRKILTAASILSAEQSHVPWNPKIVIRDVRKPLPYPANTFDAIYASHLLEHLYLNEGRRLLGECFRILRPGGVLRMVVPDLRAAVHEYLRFAETYNLQQSNGHTPADFLNSKLLLREPATRQGSVFGKIYTGMKDFHSHKWMYDAPSLCAEFAKSGFTDVSELPLHQSRIAGIEEVEDPSRVLNGEGVCVEGLKPVSASS